MCIYVYLQSSSLIFLETYTIHVWNILFIYNWKKNKMWKVEEESVTKDVTKKNVLKFWILPLFPLAI